MKVSRYQARDGLSLGDICALQGVDPELYQGFVTILVPIPAPEVSPLLLTDAPQSMALINVLAAAIASVAEHSQEAIVAGDDAAMWEQQ